VSLKASRAAVVAIGLVLLGGVGFLAWRSGLLARTDPDALWKVVHGLCVRDERINHAPAPCVAVDLDKGYAVLRDQRGKTQVLVIPTTRVTGIEDPAVLAPSAPNYWLDAWDARAFVQKLAGRPLPRDDVVLAINSVYGRSQNQLHIHVDCIKTDVKADLDANIASVGPTWSDFPAKLRGLTYRAIWIPGADLGDNDPFKILATDPIARADMTHETLAVIAATSPAGAPGFVLVAERQYGHAETLQDHSCRVLGLGGD
jgi:CDP-diacylglycerol pyrophosphatase